MSGIIRSIWVRFISTLLILVGTAGISFAKSTSNECFLLGAKFAPDVELNTFYTIDESFDKSHAFRGYDSTAFPVLNRRACIQFELNAPRGSVGLNITASAQFKNKFTKQGQVQPRLKVFVVPKDRLSYGPGGRAKLDMAGLEQSLCSQSKPFAQQGAAKMGLTTACMGRLHHNKPTLVILFLGSGVDNYIEPNSVRMRMDILPVRGN